MVMIWINDTIKRLQRYTTRFMTIAFGYAAKTVANQRMAHNLTKHCADFKAWPSPKIESPLLEMFAKPYFLLVA